MRSGTVSGACHNPQPCLAGGSGGSGNAAPLAPDSQSLLSV